MPNQLANETSPYLLQHADNPVDWRPWGPEAFAEARRLDKPVLLSVGYAACHWCHVMAHESFDLPAVAQLMNRLFVNIKVDREERPDIDAIYQHALAMLGEQGGWPLTMFLTPDAKPFWGGTYFPPEERWGRPGFPTVLQRMGEAYANEKEQVGKNTAALTEGLARLSATEAADAPPLTRGLLNTIADKLRESIDPQWGGFGGAPKFPNTPQLELLWRGWRRNGDSKLRDAVQVSLLRMSQGGVYDHVGGGFARYSTDETWLVPHFEKMLYDNAQLLDLLLHVWRDNQSLLAELRIRETVGWLLREMVADGGGFASTLDADSEGVEGKFYVWSENEIDALLEIDAPLFKETYGVTPGGNWEGHTILNRNHQPELLSREGEEDLARMRAVLLEARDQRVKPGWDDKVLADWNGLMIAALASAAMTFDEPGWLRAAFRAFDFVATKMSDGDRLWHAARGGKVRNAGLLEDYANMAHAALALHEATAETRFLDRAKDWAHVVETQFHDSTQGGYFQTAADGEQLIARPRSAFDNAVPAGNATMVGVFARLYLFTGDEVYRTRADALLAAFAPELGRNFFPLASFLNNFDLWTEPKQIVVVGDRSDPAIQAMIRTAYRAPQPNRVLTLVTPGTTLPAAHPAAGKGQVQGRATAYVCTGPVCSLPVTDADELENLLSATGAANDG